MFFTRNKLLFKNLFRLNNSLSQILTENNSGIKRVLCIDCNYVKVAINREEEAYMNFVINGYKPNQNLSWEIWETEQGYRIQVYLQN